MQVYSLWQQAVDLIALFDIAEEGDTKVTPNWLAVGCIEIMAVVSDKRELVSVCR